MLKWYPIQCARADKPPIVLRDLNLQPLAHELATPRPIVQRRQNKVVRVRLCKSTNIKPSDGLRKGTGRISLDRVLKEFVESLQEARAGELCAEGGGEGFMAVEDGCPCVSLRVSSFPSEGMSMNLRSR